MSEEKPVDEPLKTIQPVEVDTPAEIVGWILEGQSHHDILEAAIQLFNLDRVDAPQKLMEAYNLLLQELEPEHRLAWHLEARRELYRKSLEVNDYRTALQVLQDLAKLEGLIGKAQHKRPQDQTPPKISQPEPLEELPASRMEDLIQ